MFFLLIIAKKQLILCIVPYKFFPEAKAVVCQLHIIWLYGEGFAGFQHRVREPFDVVFGGVAELLAVVEYRLAGDLEALYLAYFFCFQYNRQCHTRVLLQFLGVACVFVGLYDEYVACLVVGVETVATIRLTPRCCGEGQHVVLLDEVDEFLVYHNQKLFAEGDAGFIEVGADDCKLCAAVELMADFLVLIVGQGVDELFGEYVAFFEERVLGCGLG